MENLKNLKVVDHKHSCEILSGAGHVLAVVLGFPEKNLHHANVFASSPELLDCVVTCRSVLQVLLNEDKNGARGRTIQKRIDECTRLIDKLKGE